MVFIRFGDEFGPSLVALLARTPWILVVGRGLMTCLSAALAPAAMTRAGRGA